MELQDVLLGIAQATTTGVLALDAGGSVAFMNRAMETMLGVALADVRGEHVSDVLGGWTDEDESMLQKCLAGETRLTSLRLLAAPARARDAQVGPFHDARGEVGGVFIHVRPPATDSIVPAPTYDPRFRIMADASPVLLWLADTNGDCNFFNQRWLDFTGRTMEMEHGVGWAEGVHAEDFQHCMSTFMNALVVRREFRMEYRLRRADGEYRWLLDTGIPHYGADGEFLGYIGSCIDVTELKNVRDTLDRTVRERTAELESFAYSVSHDLRAPLRAIDGFGRELVEQYGASLDDRAQHYLTRICAATQRMSALIDGLLALSRITRAELVRAQVDLSAMARSIVDELREREPTRKVDANIGDGLSAVAEPRLARALLENLLANAWKFTSRRDCASIEVGRLDDSVFYVRDDGAGFDMEHAGRLFAPFHRLHSTHQFEGTGIGLATVQRIATRHGGRVWAEAAVDKGATFFFMLEGAR
jgi:PAS domain S-box-containing protein